MTTNSLATNDSNVTPSRHGNIFTKYRKMIVVACHDQVGYNLDFTLQSVCISSCAQKIKDIEKRGGAGTNCSIIWWAYANFKPLQHYVSVPLYTHNGQGLVHKNGDEYISIRDASVPSRPLHA